MILLTKDRHQEHEQLSIPGHHIVRQATGEQQAEQARQHRCRPYASRSTQQHFYDRHSGGRVADRLNIRA